MIAYIGIKPCGCVVAITTGAVKYMARDVQNYIRHGYKVECVDIQDGKKRLQRCKHGKAGCDSGDKIIP